MSVFENLKGTQNARDLNANKLFALRRCALALQIFSSRLYLHNLEIFFWTKGDFLTGLDRGLHRGLDQILVTFLLTSHVD
jgi:hypothetical protein